MNDYTRIKQEPLLIDSHTRAEVLTSIDTAKAFASEVGVSPDEYELEDELERISLRFSLGCRARDDTVIDCSIFYYAAGVWDVCVNFTTPRFQVDLPVGHSSAADAIVRDFREKGFYAMYSSHILEEEGSFTWHLSKTLPSKRATVKQLEVVFDIVRKVCSEIMQKAECSFWAGFNSAYMDTAVVKDELWNLMHTEIDVFEVKRDSITELHMEACGEVENQDITISISDNKAEINAVVYFLSFEPRKTKCLIEKSGDDSFKVYGKDLDGVITRSIGSSDGWVYKKNDKKRKKRSCDNDSGFTALCDADGTIRFFLIKTYGRYQKMAEVVPCMSEALDELKRSLKLVINTEEQFGSYYGIFAALPYLISGCF